MDQVDQLKNQLTNILGQYQQTLFAIGDLNPSNTTFLKGLMQKIGAIENYLANLDLYQPKIYHKESEFHAAFEDYNNTLKKMLLEAVSHIEFNEHEISQLFPNKNFLQHISSLFFKQPEADAQKQKQLASINDAIHQANEGLQNLKR